MERQKRFLVDNDGNNLFANLSENFERDIEEAVEEFPDNVTTYLVCPGSGTYYFPTQVAGVDPNATRLIQLHAEGKDPFGIFLRGLRKRGVETFLTFRMNDVHNPKDIAGWNIPRVRIENPDCVVNLEAVQNGSDYWLDYCLDYSRQEVRDYFSEIFHELVDGYELDGVLLDWMRFPNHLSGTAQQVWEKRTFITDFIAQLRDLLNQSGIKLSARIPTSADGCKRLGLDIGEWSRKKLVDFLVASPFLTTEFWMPIDGIRREIDSDTMPLYGAFDFNHATQDHCPESLRAAMTSIYDLGCDGVYVFNFPCWTERIAANPFDWLEGLDDPENARKKPLLFSATHGNFRVAEADLGWALPKNVEAGESVDVTLYLPQTALPARRARLLLYTGGDVAVRVNGAETEDLPHRRRLNLFLESFCEANLQGKSFTRDDCRVLRFDPNALRAGANTVTIENLAGKPLEIYRVNLGLW